MTQNILTAGNGTVQSSLQGGDDGTFVLKVGPNGSQVNALTIDASGNPTFSQLSQVFGANGYKKLDGGLIIQWGEYSITGVHGSTYTPTFPIPFPNSVYQVVPSVGNTISTTVTSVFATMTAMTLSNFTYQYGAINGGSYGHTIRWFAIGK